MTDLDPPQGRAIPGLDYGLSIIDGQNAPPPSRDERVESDAGYLPGMHEDGNPSSDGYGVHGDERGYERSDGASDHYDERRDRDDRTYDENTSNNGLLPDNFQARMQHIPPPMSPEEQRRRKIEALAKLRRLEAEGFLPAEGGKGYSFATSLSELEETVSRLTAQRELDNSIKFQQKILMGVASAVEKVCEDPEWNIFGLHLHGWSETVYENITDYNDVFTELHYKYKDTISIPPELKLLGMVAGSAWMFHMSRTAFGKAREAVPNFDEVMQQNPELQRQYRDTAAGLAQQRGVAPNPMFAAPAYNMPTQPPRPQPPRPQPTRATGRRVVRGRGKNSQPRTRGKANPRPAMDGPDSLDIDGLLSTLNQNDGGREQTPSEVDLSEIENYSSG